MVKVKKKEVKKEKIVLELSSWEAEILLYLVSFVTFSECAQPINDICEKLEREGIPCKSADTIEGGDIGTIDFPTLEEYKKGTCW